MKEAAPERIVVAIPTLNEERHIAETIRQLMTGDSAMQRVTVIVADGGSNDRTREIVAEIARAHPNVRLVDNPDRLQAAAVNRVAEIAAQTPGVDILVRCDAHAGYPPGFVRGVAASLLASGADSLVVPMDSIGAAGFQNAVAWVSDTPLGSGGSAHRGGVVSAFVDHGHHAGFRLERFRALGGYDETFSHNEDAEYDRRLVAVGGRIFMDAALRIDYYPRATWRGLWRQYRNYGRGRARTVLKHAMRPKPRQLIPAVNLVLLAFGVIGAAASPWTLAWPALYLGVLIAVSLGLAILKRSWDGLLAGPALAAMHNGWGLGFLETLLGRLLSVQAGRRGSPATTPG
jgi:succinoglycan biosynthesis protein ExoA